MSQKVTIVLEGATYGSSVALLRETEIISERTLHSAGDAASRGGRGERLLPAVAECMTDAHVQGADVGRIICGAGPGSFTSLRIAASVAKGLAVAYHVPLYAVSSLLLIVAGTPTTVPSGSYMSLLNAMREEYFALRVHVDDDGRIGSLSPTEILSATDLEMVKTREPDVRFIGPEQEIDAPPHARGAARLLDEIVEKGSVDLDSWEPDYGRLAEAQVRWEATHGRPLAS